MIMSSNAFARSRPRVRHQRVPRTVPRTHSCDHPRFLQLVDELARTNDIRKKQQEVEGKNDCSSNSSISANTTNQSGDNSATCVITNSSSSNNTLNNSNTNNNNNNCDLSTCSTSSSSSSSTSSSSSSSSSASSTTGSISTSITSTLSSTNAVLPDDDNNSTRNSITSATSSSNADNIRSGLNLNTITGACCNSSISNTPNSSNSFRSLAPNATNIQQPSSTSAALHDNYLNHLHYNHPISQTNHYPHQTHQLHLHNPQQQHHHHNAQIQHHNLDRHHFSQQPLDNRCPGKTTNAFGYAKQNIVEHQNTSTTESHNQLSSTANNNDNTNSDLRQDENRSKRKRSTNDLGSKKSSTSSNVCGGSSFGSSSSDNVNKKHKSAPESFTTCPICLLDCMDRNPSFTNTCFHLFCYVCIENWTKNKATCPLCRTKFTKIIHKIKSATEYEEKVASPVRRDEEDRYERLIIEQLSDFNSNSNVSSRNTNSDGVQFLFENLSRNHDALIPQYFVSNMDPRQNDSLHSFNPVTSTANFTSNAPTQPFTNTSYPIAHNYLVDTLLPPNRIAPMTSTAITSAYNPNSSLASNASDTNLRRISRSIRSMYSRGNYDSPGVEGSARVTRASNTAINPPVTVERHPHYHQPTNYPTAHHHHSHRPTIDTGVRGWQGHRVEQPHPPPIPPGPYIHRHYNPPNVGYQRRSYSNPTQLEYSQQLNILYRNLPDMQ